jgi:hypothetical protein
VNGDDSVTLPTFTPNSFANYVWKWDGELGLSPSDQPAQIGISQPFEPAPLPQPTFASVVALGAHRPALSTPIKIAAAQTLFWDGLPPAGMQVKKRLSKGKSASKPYVDGDNGYWRGNSMIPSSQYCPNVIFLVMHSLHASLSVRYVCCSEHHGRLQSAADKSEHQVRGSSVWDGWCCP